jgi:uncharacterized protein DUF6502
LQVSSKKTAIGRARAELLLAPIAAFLHADGLSEREAEQSFKSAFHKARNRANARRIDRIGHPTRYADIVALWTRDTRFIDTTGCPKPLTWAGKAGFRALVSEASPTSDPRAVMLVFTRYGNVRRTKEGKYKLVRPFFLTSGRKRMAFEPMAYFLSDASATLGRILTRTSHSRAPELFWRKVETVCLSETTAKRFIEFVSHRSLTFLEEVDEWLDAQRSAKNDRLAHESFRRVGLGLFSIYSEPELSDDRR